MVALILGFAAYALSQPDALGDAFRRTATRDALHPRQPSSSSFRCSGLSISMWATVPLSIGGSKQFDAGKLLMYPITLAQTVCRRLPQRADNAALSVRNTRCDRDLHRRRFRHRQHDSSFIDCSSSNTFRHRAVEMAFNYDRLTSAS